MFVCEPNRRHWMESFGAQHQRDERGCRGLCSCEENIEAAAAAILTEKREKKERKMFVVTFSNKKLVLFRGLWLADRRKVLWCARYGRQYAAFDATEENSNWIL